MERTIAKVWQSFQQADVSTGAKNSKSTLCLLIPAPALSSLPMQKHLHRYVMSQMGEMIQTENNLAKTKKDTLPSPLNLTSSSSSPGVVHAWTQGQELKPSGRERVGLLLSVAVSA